jgi:hypothetical protein
MDTITLADLIDTREEQPPVLIAFPGSSTFKVQVRPMGNRHQEFIQQATEPVWDEALMKKTMVLNQEVYLQLFGAHVVVGWQGLMVPELRRLVMIADFKKMRKFAKGEIAFDDEARRILVTWSPLFKTWLQNVSFNIELLNREREEQLEKKFWKR